MTLPQWIPPMARVMPFGDARVTGVIDVDARPSWRADLEDALGGFGTVCGPTRDSPWPSPMKSRYHGGISGLTATTAATSVYGYVATHTPRLIILSVGLEDIIAGRSASATLDACDAVIRSAVAARPAVSFIWLTLTPLIGSYAAYDSVRLAFNAGIAARIATHAANGVEVTKVSAGEAIDDTATQMDTDIAPNLVGYAAMGAVIGPAVRAWLREHEYPRANA